MTSYFGVSTAMSKEAIAYYRELAKDVPLNPRCVIGAGEAFAAARDIIKEKGLHPGSAAGLAGAITDLSQEAVAEFKARPRQPKRRYRR